MFLFLSNKLYYLYLVSIVSFTFHFFPFRFVFVQNLNTQFFFITSLIFKTTAVAWIEFSVKMMSHSKSYSFAFQFGLLVKCATLHFLFLDHLTLQNIARSEYIFWKFVTPYSHDNIRAHSHSYWMNWTDSTARCIFFPFHAIFLIICCSACDT